MTTRRLTCCICGDDAGRYEQHWNRDTGWGVCRGCVDGQIRRGVPFAEIQNLYGIEGVNYESRATITGTQPGVSNDD